jgi:hypothetical protein
VIVDGEVHGLRQCVSRKLHQLASGQRNRGQTQYCLVPAVIRNIDGVSQSSIDLIAEHDGGDEFRCIRSLGLRNRETCRNMIARMSAPKPSCGGI